MRDNVEKTRVLAQAARIGGARRFIFLSTIKVNGEETPARAFTSTDSPNPQDAYGRSKWEAEQVIVAVDGLEAVIVRSPLVFGPSAKGNLRSLLLLADTPWPLPLASHPQPAQLRPRGRPGPLAGRVRDTPLRRGPDVSSGASRSVLDARARGRVAPPPCASGASLRPPGTRPRMGGHAVGCG